MSIKKILIWGCYGEDNIGDEAILESMIASIRLIDNSISIAVFSSNPTQTASRYAVGSILDLNFFKSKHWLGLYLRGECLRIIKAIKNCDILIVGGGELLRDDYGLLPLLGILDKVMIAKMLGKKIMGYGLGVCHFRTFWGKIIGRFGIDMFDIITTRDTESMNNLTNLNIKKPKCYIAADPAINYAARKQIDLNSGKLRKAALQKDDCQVVGISLRDKVSGKTQEEMVSLQKELRQAFGRLSEDGRCRFNYIPLQIASSQDDRIPADRIMPFLKAGSMQILDYADNFYPEAIAKDLAKIDVLIGMRLHACIIAASLGIPCIALSYDDKVRKFMHEIGLEDYVLGVDGFNGNWLLQTVDKLRVNYDNVVKSMQKRVEALQINEKKNAEMLLFLMK